MKKVKIEEQYIEGAVSLERKADGIKPWRLPYNNLVLFPSDPEGQLIDRAERLAGIRLRFVTDSLQLIIVVNEFATREPDEPCLFDLTIDNECHQTVELAVGETHVNFEKLPKGKKTIDIWLPQFKSLVLRHILIDNDSLFMIPQEKRLRWITYGSSITHCRTALSPSRTWPAIVSRKHNLNLMCLGYGGQCHLDSMIAQMIRDLEVDLITLKLGINVYGAASLSPRTFKAAIIGFVQIIREKHPEIPIGVISPIYSSHREMELNQTGFSLLQMRHEVKDAVQRLISNGDKRVRYFSGLELFDCALAENYLPDNLHPSGEGYEFMAEKMLGIMGKIKELE